MTAGTPDPIAILLDEHKTALALFAELEGAFMRLHHIGKSDHILGATCWQGSQEPR